MLIDSSESLKRTEIIGSLSLTNLVETHFRHRNPSGGKTHSLLVRNMAMMGSSGKWTAGQSLMP